ncbi:MAG: hypothetical protein ACC663_10860 [Gammaproteobacteria bacterium]
MTKTPDIVADQRTLEGHAAELGALILEREREESSSVRDNQKLTELERKIALQKRLVTKMLNEKKIPTSPPNRPHLKIVK